MAVIGLVLRKCNGFMMVILGLVMKVGKTVGLCYDKSKMSISM